MINDNSYLISKIMGISIPFVIMAGIYVIVNGHASPGGGFQGGALLSSALISKYLFKPVNDISIAKTQYVEKLLLFFIILIFVSFLATGINNMNIFPVKKYILFMNILIGLKVTCGMSIIFYQFVFFEGR